jgi:D-glycero-D-manno-heptose 1,7-bisphosphate phosphatase
MDIRHKPQTRTKKGKQRGGAGSRPASTKGAPAVFLDRDGTICEEVGYVNHVDRIRLFPWAAEAIRKLNEAGLPVIVVTNQSGVGRGYFSEDLVKQANVKIAMELASEDARLEAFYYCPHHPTATVEAYRKNCRCRKPATGMMEEAAKRFGLDLKSSYVVGDSFRDMQLAFNSGAKSILVLTGYGKGEYEYHRKGWPRLPDLVAQNLLEAVEKILNGSTPSRRRSKRRR